MTACPKCGVDHLVIRELTDEVEDIVHAILPDQPHGYGFVLLLVPLEQDVDRVLVATSLPYEEARALVDGLAAGRARS